MLAGTYELIAEGATGETRSHANDDGLFPMLHRGALLVFLKGVLVNTLGCV